jgi:hypothetical protein
MTSKKHFSLKTINDMTEYNIKNRSLWSMDYQILNGEGLEMGNLKFNNVFLMSAEASARFREYTFKTKGWGMDISVMDERGVEIGEVKRSYWKDKTIFTYKDKTYLFRRIDWTRNAYIWKDMEERKIFSFKPNYWSSRGTIRVYDSHREEEVTDLLMLLGTFLMAIRLYAS